MTRTLTAPASVSLAEFDAMFEAVKNWGTLGTRRRARHAELPDPGQGCRRRPGEERAHRVDGHPDQQGGRARQPESCRAPHVADARPAREPKRAVVRDVLSRHGQPRRLPHPRRCAQSRRLPGAAVQRQAGLAADLARLGLGQHRRVRERHRRARRPVGCGPPPRGRLARARRGRDPRGARGDRGRRRRAPGGGRHPGVPHRPPCKAPGARRWSNEYPPAGEGKAGLHVDTVPWMHERRIAAFLPDGDGETVPSNVEGMPYPIHPLQLTAMGMLRLGQPATRGSGEGVRAGGTLEFMVVGLPLRLPGATGSPWNPIAIF